jgi:uncharacterized protein (UPF0548 family)
MDFLERMEAGRDQAAYRRHRGLTTGKSAAGWDVVRRELEAGTWNRHFASAKAAVQCAIAIAQEDYLRAVFPERYSDVTLDDVIADRLAGEAAAILETF